MDVTKLNRFNQLLVETNKTQTRRCRQLRGGVRLLDEVFTSAQRAECGETGETGFVIKSELWERIGAYLADFVASAQAGLPDEGEETRQVGVRQ